MNRSTFWMIKYMNGSLFSKARYMNGVGFEILARTPVPKLPLSYPPPLPEVCSLCAHAIVRAYRVRVFKKRKTSYAGPVKE